ncbi:hypothetical protein ABPG74_009243 [Tetrahymena malaccensis]
MRILIVNGYSKNKSGIKKFADFHYLIMKIMTEQKELVDTETEFFIRDKNNLDDYLYEIESSHLKKEAANNFDQLDMVFVIGDTNVRPWSPSMRKIITLMRMCLRVKKYLFASAWGMQALVFLSASNMEKNINIINGNGDGGKLSDIQTTSSNLKSIKPSDYFLDNTTGDLYGFNYETNEWIPKGNCGLHSRRSAQEFQSLGKFILKAPVYKPNTEHKEKYKLYKSRKYEETCRIKKMHMHHWAFQDLDDEFIIPLKNNWDIHTFAFVNPSKHFNVLADSERGAIVVEMENILAVLFATNTKYPNTIQILRNFIWNTLKKIKSHQGQNAPSISSFQFIQKESTIEETLRKQKEKGKRSALVLLNKRTSQMGFHQVESDDNKTYTKSDVFLHVGYSAKKSHVPQFVFHNMVNDKKLKIKEGQLKMSQNDPANNRYFDNEDFDIIDENQSTILKNTQTFTDFHTKPNETITDSNTKPSQSQRKSMQFKITLKKQEQLYTSGGIRKFLHPQISNELLDFNKLWVPGNLSSPENNLKRGLFVPNQTGVSFMSNKTRKTNQSRLQTTDSSTTLVKSRTQRGKDFGEFKSLFVDSPYISPDEIYKRDIKEKNEKIIGDKDFRVGAAHYDHFSIYKSQSDFNSGCPPSSYFRHQFRPQNKDKWVTEQNFKLV